MIELICVVTAHTCCAYWANYWYVEYVQSQL